MAGQPKYVTDEAIDKAVYWLAHGWRKSQVKNKLREFFNDEDVDARTIERILSRARERLRENIDIDLADARSDAIEFYSSILRDDDAEIKLKIQARARLDKILGTEAQFTNGSNNPTTDDPLTINATLDVAAPPPGTVPAMEQPGEVQDGAIGQAVGQDGATQA